MPRYIDAENIERGIQDLKSSPYAMDETWTKACFAVRNTLDIVLDLCVKTEPTADVEPVRHGRMVEDGNLYKCPLCGGEWNAYDAFGDLQLFDFCPYCGAKIDGWKEANGDAEIH